MSIHNDRSAIDLKDFDDDFASAAVPSTEEVPDGKYQARVDKVRLDQSRKGDPMIKWDMIVISGPHEGRHIFRNSVITSASLPFVKRDLQLLGLGLAKISDLGSRLEDLLDVTVELTKRTRGEFSNVYFDKRIQIAAGGPTRPASGDIPF